LDFVSTRAVRYGTFSTLAEMIDMTADHLRHPQLSQLDILHRISRIVSSESSLDRMLLELINIVAEVTRCDACLVFLPDSASSDVVLRASQLPHTAEIGNVRLKIGQGVAGWVAEHKTVVALSRNAAADTRFLRFPVLVEDTFQALVSVPLISGGDVIGVMNIHHRESHEHSPAEIALLSFVGEQMGNAIASSRLGEDIARLQAQTAEMQQQLIARTMVERAKGVLQQKYRLNEQQAYARLRNESRRQRRPMRELAREILLVEAAAETSGSASSRT
jgi:uroporphyrinogen-III synthase